MESVTAMETVIATFNLTAVRLANGIEPVTFDRSLIGIACCLLGFMVGMWFTVALLGLYPEREVKR